MKKISQCLFLILSISLFSCARFERIGSLTMVSTRNIDSKHDYKLIKKNVEGKAKLRGENAMQDAIDNTVKQLPDGEFLKNASIYIKSNGKWIKVVGDVWGVPTVESVIVSEKIELKVGDRIAFKNKSGKILEGKIIGVSSTNAIIEYEKEPGKLDKTEMDFNKLTKLQN